jgi:iron complex outermembrane receptor protein
VRRFAGVPGFDKYQTETGAISSLFEHSFRRYAEDRQNMRYTHVEGIYRSSYPTLWRFRRSRPNRIFRFSIRRGAPWSALSSAAKPARTVSPRTATPS